MAEQILKVATAISDPDQESYIATSMSRMGWRVSYRATEFASLSKFLDEHPDTFLIISDDFRGVELSTAFQRLVLRGKSRKLISGGVDFPLSEPELNRAVQSILYSVEEPISSLDAIDTRVVTIASLERGVGVTTIALNMAEELQLIGESILLLDCNLAHPSISKFSGVNGINRSIVINERGIALLEVSTRDDIEKAIAQSLNYTAVVVDLGQLHISDRTISGNRIGDLLTSWVLRSTRQLHLVYSHNCVAEGEKLLPLREISSIASITYIDQIIVLDEILGRRERDRIAQLARENSGIESYIYSRDRRSVVATRRKKASLAAVAPKSVLRTEIQDHLLDAEKYLTLKGR